MRRINDNYPSEPAMLARLLSLLAPAKLKRDHIILEPCAGAGQLASPLKQAGYNVITNDIDPDYDCDYSMDATSPDFWIGVGHFNWVITNPPYKNLGDLLEMSLDMASCGVAMILRLSALEPACVNVDRGFTLDYNKDNMRYIMPFSGPRPSFTKDGKTDSVTTAWFVWDKGWSWKSYGMESPFQFAMNWKDS